MSEERVKSTHQVLVVPVILERHPNADLLSIVRIDGFTCVVRTSDWINITRAAWIPPDSLVDTAHPSFAFLAEKAQVDGIYRVKAMRLRGVLSFGLLVPMLGFDVGLDVTELLRVTHYEPPVNGGGGGEVESPPRIPCPIYDLDAFRKYASSIFSDGEPVVVTEKLHGANARYVFHDGKMYCGSRSQWKREHPTSIWWKALANTPTLSEFCLEHPGWVVYGEVFGAVQDLCYGHKNGAVSFRAFDIMQNGVYLDATEAIGFACTYEIPWAPLFNKLRMSPCNNFYEGIEPIPYNFEALCEMAEGKTIISGANHVREGVVICPMKERRHDLVGRVKLKIVGAGYLEKSK